MASTSTSIGRSVPALSTMPVGVIRSIPFDTSVTFARLKVGR
ncbi:Uncharacterised protein [Mycobacteroides abscessus subsp. abscessus]|nr:Uncharacterised protein [Mycobacteroides abscessus subsp. abscessus]SKV66096.1 Uncharacterised protein [Mycobacteroides abscessus subsp. abscessus]